MPKKRIDIRTFTPADWLLYKETRLSALKESPDAFGSTYEGAITIPDHEWETRIVKLDREHNLPIAAFVGDALAGMAWVRVEDTTAHLFQMWVSPEFRGLSVGSSVLKTAMEWASERGAAVMCLGVTLGESPAKHMYESAGFSSTGVEPLRDGSELLVQNMEYSFERSI